MNCLNYNYTVPSTCNGWKACPCVLSIKHAIGALRYVEDKGIDACMNFCPACTLGIHSATNCQIFMGKGTQTDKHWSASVNVCIGLGNDWIHKYEPHLIKVVHCKKKTMNYTVPNKATLRYPNVTHSCCL